MSQQQYREIQEDLFSYCDNLSDIELWALIRGIVYGDEEGSASKTIIDVFVEEFGIREALENWRTDIANPSSYFIKGTRSQIDFIEKIQSALLNVAFHRWQKLLKQQLKK